MEQLRIFINDMGIFVSLVHHEQLSQGLCLRKRWRKGRLYGMG